jgi:DNA-directed RNA polymerase specialized sigma24 family protein
MSPDVEHGLAVTTALASVDIAVQAIIRQKLRVSLRASDPREQNLDAFDVLGEVRLKLLKRLSQGEASATAIAEFRAYATTVAYHCCADYLRAKYPQRTSLKNCLRRLLDKADGYAAWTAASGEVMCGFAGWQNGKVHADTAALAKLRQDPGAIPEQALPKVSAQNLSALEWLRLLDAVFKEAAGPVSLDDLIAIVAPLAGVEDVADLFEDEAHGDDGIALDRLPAPGMDPHAALLCVERLKLFWGAVLQLLPWHRAAYLLNLRDGDLDALPYYGIVSIEGIAAALELTPLQLGALEQALGIAGADRPGDTGLRFATCWKHLPLDDKTIAETLGVTRAQVIAYRNKAKERLARNLKALL